MRLCLILTIIISTCFSGKVAGQVKKTMHFSYQYGMFCRETIILDSTGLFFNEAGCEGQSDISYGRYKLTKDNRIIFKHLPFDSLQPISKIMEGPEAEQRDSLITITFYDRYRQPLGAYPGILLSDTSNRSVEKYTDEQGRIQINHFEFNYVSLAQFLTIYRETDGIKIGNRSIDIYLYLPNAFIIYPELQLSKPRPLYLQLKEKGLYDFKTKKIAFKLEQ